MQGREEELVRESGAAARSLEGHTRRCAGREGTWAPIRARMKVCWFAWLPVDMEAMPDASTTAVMKIPAETAPFRVRFRARGSAVRHALVAGSECGAGGMHTGAAQGGPLRKVGGRAVGQAGRVHAWDRPGAETMGDTGHTSGDDGRVLAKVVEHEYLEGSDMDLLSRAGDDNGRAALCALGCPGGGALHGAGRSLDLAAENHLLECVCVVVSGVDKDGGGPGSCDTPLKTKFVTTR